MARPPRSLHLFRARRIGCPHRVNWGSAPRDRCSPDSGRAILPLRHHPLLDHRRHFDRRTTAASPLQQELLACSVPSDMRCPCGGSPRPPETEMNQRFVAIIQTDPLPNFLDFA